MWAAVFVAFQFPVARRTVFENVSLNILFPLTGEYHSSHKHTDQHQRPKTEQGHRTGLGCCRRIIGAVVGCQRGKGARKG